jgi:hypothetical protein
VNLKSLQTDAEPPAASGREPKSFARLNRRLSRVSKGLGYRFSGRLGDSVNMKLTGSSGSEADARVVYSRLMRHFRSRPKKDEAHFRSRRRE